MWRAPEGMSHHALSPCIQLAAAPTHSLCVGRRWPGVTWVEYKATALGPSARIVSTSTVVPPKFLSPHAWMEPSDASTAKACVVLATCSEGRQEVSGQAAKQGRKEASMEARSERVSQVSWACLCCKSGVVLATCVTPPAAMIACLVLIGRSPPAIGSPHASTPPTSPAPAWSLAAKAYLVAYTASTPAAPSSALTPAVGCSSSPPEMASPHTVSAPSACSAAKAAPVLAMLIAGLPSRPVSFSAWWGLG